MLILIDNYDSFTYNVYHYFSELKAKIKIFRNDQIEIEEIEKINPNAIIISPGPCTPDDAGICIELIKKYKNKFPIFGICLGHQCIGQAFGGTIVQCKEIMHGKIDNMSHFGHPLFDNIDLNFSATRYHSLIIENKTLNNEFEIIAENKHKIIMGIAHKKLPIYGLQFHPESIGTKNGKTILNNFLKLIKYEY
tara:strand:+ start:1962 stop:2540 length:579 start_codon:yes stop_codon:yes gene_type:complete